MSDEEDRLIDRFSIVGDTSVPYGIIFVMPVLENDNPDAVLNTLRGIIKGAKLYKMVIDTILFGRIPKRRLDYQYTDIIGCTLTLTTLPA